MKVYHSGGDMAQKTLVSTSRTAVAVGATTPNPKAIREAAERFAQVRAKEMPRGELLKKLGLAR